MLAYTDAANKVTNYTYPDSATATGSRPQQKIEDPLNQSGARPTTTFEYFGDGGNVDRVHKVHYAKASGAADYVWDYLRTNDSARCEDKSQYSTDVIDQPGDGSSAPRGTTSYCFKNADAELANTRVYDAEGNVKQTEYTADMGAKAFQAASNATGGTEGSTVAEYGAPGDQLNKVTEPKTAEDGNTAGTTTFAYDSAEKYQPSATTNANGECSSFKYDSAGRTTAAYTGLASDTCSETGKSGFRATTTATAQ